MQKPKPYRSPMRRGARKKLPPRRLRRAAAEARNQGMEIVFEWEEEPATQH